jgi:glycine/D-amino acid oxidase-like deaminating enzyme
MCDQLFDVVVVGGGIMGACAAYYVSKYGIRVFFVIVWPARHGPGHLQRKAVSRGAGAV